MNLSLQPLTDQAALDHFLSRPDLRPYASFFQTWEWGQFQESLGRTIHRCSIIDGSTMIGSLLLIAEPDRFGTIAYAPRGPVIDWTDQARASAVLKLLVNEARRLIPQAVCLRLDPPIVHDTPETAAFRLAGLRAAAKFTQVERAWMADLQPTWDAQLNWQTEHGMRSNLPRYLRRAEREGVTVRSSDDPADLEIFLTMIQGLDARKNGIGLHPLDYYRRQFGALSPSGYERVFVCEYQGVPLAAALIAVYGREASYLWGASTDQERQLRGPHYMHFQIMRYAYEHGCERYNFWGVVKDEHHHPSYRGYGFSEFKRSFGGYIELYQRTQEYVYRPLPYALTRLNDRRRLRAGQMD